MKPEVIDFTPPADLSPLHASSDEYFTQPAPKVPGRADADKFSILVVLVVVVLAIIAVIAGGVYLYLHDAPPPPPKLKQLSQTHPIIDDPPVEKINMPGPPLLVSEPRIERPDELTSVAQAAVPDTPPPKQASKPKSRAKTREPSSVPDRTAEATARDPPTQDDPPPPDLAQQADTQLEASTDSATEGDHQAIFHLALGVVVETRTYPSRKMKQRALELWTAEKKILEPDGSINDKYVLKKSDFSPIPGH